MQMSYLASKTRHFMYILINEKTKESAIFNDKTQLCKHINVSTKTILRNEHKKYYKKGDFIIYFPNIIKKKSTRGGNRKLW